MIRPGTQEASPRNVNFFPRRTNMDIAGIAVPEQKLQLVDGQNTDPAIAFIGPPAKRPLGQPLMAKPEPLAVIGQYPDSRLSSVPENKDSARKGVHVQDMSANPS